MFFMNIFVLLFSSVYCEDLYNKATCYYEGENIKILTGEINKQIGYAWANWEDTINSTGTSYIVIETSNIASSTITSEKKIKCAGYVDGYLMQMRIWNRWLLQKDILNVPRNESFSNTWTDWMQDNIDYTRKQISENKDDPYWKSIGLVLSEFDGLVQGYNKAVEDNNVPNQAMTEMDFWILQSIGDIYDLQAIWEPKKERDPFSFMECSGLVTILPDYSDVFFGHDTWSDYRKMSNTVKEYIFNGIEEWNNKRMEVTTKIGALPSSEDFWITGNGLLILETTINNLNKTLQQEVRNSKNTLMTWIRNYHASWVSDSAKQWADEFLRENSGTYNNQYIIVDAKKITPKNKPTKDLMWGMYI